MTYDLIITEAAHRDLEEALSYIAGHLANPAAAARLLKQVAVCYAQLRSFPALYERCRDPRLSALGYRKVPVGNYILIYRAEEAAHKIYILRFFYGSREYERLL